MSGSSEGRPAPVLELSGIDVPFGDGRGLSGVELAVEAGERFVLVGASGVGKSSLLRAVAGSGRVSSGTVLLDGVPVREASPGDQRMVLLEQRPLLFPHMSVRANLAFPLEVRGIGRPDIERRVVDALDAVHLADLADRMPHTLSGGQGHRVALARAVIARPRVLLLDEPLASLDPTLREEMRATIVRVTGQYEVALLMVTHDLREASRIGERVGVLIDGRLAQVAPPDVLFQRPASLEVARFIGWRNELPAELASDGTVRVGTQTWTRPGDGSPVCPPGAVTLTFGAHGARLRAPASDGGVPIRVTALRHDPYGVTVEYQLEGAAARPNGRSPGGEVTVDPGKVPEVGSLASLVVTPSLVRIFPVTSRPDPCPPDERGTT